MYQYKRRHNLKYRAFTIRESEHRLTRLCLVPTQLARILGLKSNPSECILAALACRLRLHGHIAALIRQTTFPKNYSLRLAVRAILLQGLFPPRSGDRLLARRFSRLLKV